eukprot:CAMPEP_0119121340 /NCGR_PEP_ID=MMETSP1310-20130426/2024_1 /TAXON_ID=464262 /ORGANISM="Genus nov. species nov., Strain RCC2339" /LENGTH=528 /DNA_ID=CAMNT_0007110903 /DNA_START=202 /DNA_END=1785 /DNA_ORIENTATION=-
MAGVAGVDPEADSNIDMVEMFRYFDELYFGSLLTNSAVMVRWSGGRMTRCAGYCRYRGKAGGCEIVLSQPLLQFRSHKEICETLLHEMIHARDFLSHNIDNRDGHGKQFQEKMKEINSSRKFDKYKKDGIPWHITIYHSYINEVAYYERHHWKCNRCEKVIKRSMNRPPSEKDCRYYRRDGRYWDESRNGNKCGDSKCTAHNHIRLCGGTYVKIKSPPEKKSKPRKRKREEESKALPNKLWWEERAESAASGEKRQDAGAWRKEVQSDGGGKRKVWSAKQWEGHPIDLTSLSDGYESSSIEPELIPKPPPYIAPPLPPGGSVLLDVSTPPPPPPCSGWASPPRSTSPFSPTQSFSPIRSRELSADLTVIGPHVRSVGTSSLPPLPNHYARDPGASTAPPPLPPQPPRSGLSTLPPHWAPEASTTKPSPPPLPTRSPSVQESRSTISAVPQYWVSGSSPSSIPSLSSPNAASSPSLLPPQQPPLPSHWDPPPTSSRSSASTTDRRSPTSYDALVATLVEMGFPCENAAE